MPSPLRILISNDDGYQAPGIVALHAALADIAEVEVVAPEHNNSAKSNALTLHSPLSVQTAANGFRYVNGTPADCVHIALTTPGPHLIEAIVPPTLAGLKLRILPSLLESLANMPRPVARALKKKIAP